MENLLSRYENLMHSPKAVEFDTMSGLAEHHQHVRDLVEEIEESAADLMDEFQNELDRLNESVGFGTKYLGGLFGDKEKAGKIKKLKENLDQLQEISNNVVLYEETTTEEAITQATLIIGSDDSEFATLVEHRNLMDEAVILCDDVLKEVGEAIDALENAEDAEEWDMMTNDGFADMNSDMANSDAADEVADVTRILVEFRTFLHSIGENDAAYLEGSDFDFDWGDMLTESFFGDFWGSSAMLDKIADAQDDMIALQDKIVQLHDSFLVDFEQADEQVMERVDAEWEAA